MKDFQSFVALITNGTDTYHVPALTVTINNKCGIPPKKWTPYKV